MLGDSPGFCPLIFTVDPLVGSLVVLFYFFTYLFFINLFILFLAVLGLRCCAQAFSSCGERRLLCIVVRRVLIAVASLIAEHGL